MNPKWSRTTFLLLLLYLTLFLKNVKFFSEKNRSLGAINIMKRNTNRYTCEEIEAAVIKSKCYADIFKNLGITLNGGSYPWIKGLIKKFEIEDIIHQPVRKLSLGQRMRCEFVLALLHKPEVLFLDEPTIGLDITIKKTIRELIKKINREEKITVILTSHDMDDVETICNRVIVINHGEIIYDDTLDKIKEKYIDKKIIRIETNNPIIFKERTGITILKRSTFEVEAIIDTTKVDFNKITEEFLKKNSLSDVTIEEPPIEDIIEKIYKLKKKGNSF